MATATITTETPVETMADVLRRLGDIPLERVCARPAPGTATEEDLIAALDGANKRLYELVDATLVEKTMRQGEAHFAAVVIAKLWIFLDGNDLGVVYGADAPFRLYVGLVRMPDVSYISWERLGQTFPEGSFVDAAPELAVEVISPSNTKAEMKRKLNDFFQAGVVLAWLIYPITQTAEVYTSATKKKKVSKDGTLDGGAVLPGFSIDLKTIFAQANRRRPGS